MKGVAIGAVIGLLLVGNVYLLTRVNGLRTEVSDLQASFQQQVQGLEATSSVHAGDAARELEALRREVQKAREDAAGRATSEARRHSEQVAKTLAEQQRQQRDAWTGELGDVRTSAQQANHEVQVVRGDLNQVRGDVADTRSLLDQTESTLSRTQGDVDRLGSETAENGSAIEKLRRFNERDRVRFQLAKTDEMQRVGDVQLKLRKTDMKHHKYTIEILADDKLFVKKDRQVAEPVELYLANSTQPYEIVVTAVKKDLIEGYLSKPKIEMARR
jgi:ABC-type transporter Mla subunit MlaD